MAIKRFYKTAAAVAADSGSFHVQLDGHSVRTPQNLPLALPNQALATAIAEEWEAQGEDIDPQAMPLTQLANTAIDVVARNRAQVVDTVADFAQSDLVCYLAEGPPDLVQAQQAQWQPLIGWAEQRYDIKLNVTLGIIHVAQREATLAAYRRAVEAFGDLALAALHEFAVLTKSLTIALALCEGEIEPAQAWAAARVDDEHQQARWGIDEEAAAVAERHFEDLRHAGRFYRLLGGKA